MTDRELFEEALEALEHLHRTGDTQVFDLCYAPELIPALKEAGAAGAGADHRQVSRNPNCYRAWMGSRWRHIARTCR